MQEELSLQHPPGSIRKSGAPTKRPFMTRRNMAKSPLSICPDLFRSSRWWKPERFSWEEGDVRVSNNNTKIVFNSE